MLVLYIIILIAGFAALIKGADIFVDGSASLARNFRVPSLIIGLTIVALGTSAPELAVSTAAAIQKSNEIALSNVIGSNTFNLLCVLGVCAVIHPVPVEPNILKRDYPVSIVSTVFVLITVGYEFLYFRLPASDMNAIVGTVSRPVGILLISAFVVYIIYLILNAKKHPVQEETEKNISTGKCLLLIVIGIAMIVCGGEAVVYSAKVLARTMGMSETLIGLTIVAVGTSLPELVTSIVAARKGQTELAVGNVIGSNIFNLMFILGISASINPVTVNLASVCDLIILLGVSVLTLFFSVSSRRIGRPEGIVMLAIYISDVLFAVVR